MFLTPSLVLSGQPTVHHAPCSVSFVLHVRFGDVWEYSVHGMTVLVHSEIVLIAQGRTNTLDTVGAAP
jgi:hypothetical protein